MSALRVMWLYPEHMNIYADRGNIAVPPSAAASGAGSASRHAAPGPGDPFDPGAHDLFYIGGGQDRDQAPVAARHGRDQARGARRGGRRRRRPAGRLRRLPAARPRYQLGEERLPGLGLADLETVREPGPRLIGNVAIEADLGDGPQRARRLREPRRPHLPRATAAAARPGALRATATTARTASRACAAHNLIGTYLHGPLLPKNAWLADQLIAWR